MNKKVEKAELDLLMEPLFKHMCVHSESSGVESTLISFIILLVHIIHTFGNYVENVPSLFKKVELSVEKDSNISTSSKVLIHDLLSTTACLAEILTKADKI